MNAETKPAEIVSKLTAKTVGAQPKKNEITPETKAHARAIIYGRVTKSEIGSSTYGEFIKFKGRFEGINLLTGESYQSGQAILPGVVANMVEEALDSNEGQSIDFAIEIGVKYADNNYGYEYTVRPVQELKASDELDNLRQLVASQPTFKALSAPADAEPESKAKKK